MKEINTQKMKELVEGKLAKVEAEQGTLKTEEQNNEKNEQGNGGGNSGSMSIIPRVVKDGSLKFEFYTIADEVDGKVYCNVSFKKIRGIGRLEGYTLRTGTKLLKDLNEATFLLQPDEMIEFNEWIRLQVTLEHNYLFKHKTIGWGSIEEDYNVFKQEIRLHDIYTAEGNLGSEYIGELKPDLGKKGTIDGYLKGLKELVIGNPKLELAIIIGFSGFITQALKIEGVHDSNILINFTGKTSSGKTTTTKLALTPFGKSDKLLKSFNTTQAKSEVDMNVYGVIPYIIDDKLVGIDLNNKRDVNSIVAEIMSISQGKIKERHNSNEGGEFYCPVLMSSEESIAEAISEAKVKGSYYRFLEIECNNDLTKDGDHANKLDKFMSENYGEAGEVFAKHLISNYDTTLLTEAYHKEYIEVKKDGKLNHRIYTNKAIIIFTAKLINKCFNLEIDIKKLSEMIEEQINTAFYKSDKVMLKLKELRDYVTTNKKYFVDDIKNFKFAESMGVYEYDSTGRKKQLIIQPSALRHIVNGGAPDSYFKYIENKQNIDSPKADKLTRKWKLEGYLISGGSHGKTTKNTSPRILDSKQRQVYIIEFDCSNNI